MEKNSSLQRHNSVADASSLRERGKENCSKFSSAENLTTPKPWRELLSSLNFWMLALSRYFGEYGVYLVFLIIPSLMERAGFQKTDGATMVGILGISQLIGSLTIGWIVTKLKMGPILGTAASLVFVLGSAIALPFCSTYILFVIVSVIQGCFCAAYSCLQAAQIATVFGMENLTNALGMILIFRGLGNFTGPLITGILLDETGSYLLPCIVRSIMVAVTILLHLHVHFHSKKQE